MTVSGALLFIAAITVAPPSGLDSPEQNIPQSSSLLSKILPSISGERFAAIKTDAIPWCATIMNIEGELQLTDNISVCLPVWWCPWKISDSHSLKILALLPEGRWWLRTPGSGHFFGLHFTLAWFNLRHNDLRYQDAGRPMLGGGITYGYSFKLGSQWGLQLDIGAGYASMQYDRFYNLPDGAKIDRRRTSYWGIDRLGVSIVYNFNL